MNIWPAQGALAAFYGNPDVNGDGLPDKAWEAANIVRIAPPYPLFLAWAPTTHVSGIAVHKKCADSLTRILTRIGTELTEAERRRFQLDMYGGCFNYRLMRGSTNLSVHSYGAAIDLAPAINSLGAEWGSKENMMPQKVVQMFNKEGAVWGGIWRRPDAQHFQFTA